MNNKTFMTGTLLTLKLLTAWGCGTQTEVVEPASQPNQVSITQKEPVTRKVKLDINYEKQEQKDDHTQATEQAVALDSPEFSPAGIDVPRGPYGPDIEDSYYDTVYNLIQQTYDYRVFPTRFQDEGPFLYSHDIEYENLPWVEDDDYYGPPKHYRFH